jgi:ATP adenylyltransferase
MVVPNKHISSLNALEQDEISDVFETVQLCEKVLKEAYHPEGFNVGINIGKAAGAGIDEHLHVHVVPRWSGDTNFMTSVSGMRVVPDDYNNTFKLLKEAFENVGR